MQKFTDLMLDLETFGIGNDAAIVSIGIVAFNSKQGSKGNRHLSDLSPLGMIEQNYAAEFKVDLKSSKSPGVVDPATVEWWLEQSQDARKELLQGPRYELGTALYNLDYWIRHTPGYEDKSSFKLWSRGPSFDEVILRSAFRRYGVDFPVICWGARCCRTVEDLARATGWVSKHKNERKHSAIADAVHQARSVVSQTAHLFGTTPLDHQGHQIQP